jgi:hypothetical protein
MMEKGHSFYLDGYALFFSHTTPLLHSVTFNQVDSLLRPIHHTSSSCKQSVAHLQPTLLCPLRRQP